MRFLKVINSINFNFDDEIQLIEILVESIFITALDKLFWSWASDGLFWS